MIHLTSLWNPRNSSEGKQFWLTFVCWTINVHTFASAQSHHDELPNAGSAGFRGLEHPVAVAMTVLTRSLVMEGAQSVREAGKLHKFRNCFTMSTLSQFQRAFRGPDQQGAHFREGTVRVLLAGSELHCPGWETFPASTTVALPQGSPLIAASQCSGESGSSSATATAGFSRQGFADLCACPKSTSATQRNAANRTRVNLPTVSCSSRSKS